MLNPVRSSQFKKDLKKARRQGKDLNLLQAVVTTLADEEPLEECFRDHGLTGNWRGYRECHVNPDWLLIYKVDGEELKLARLGSHSELFA
ncbi:MAG: type II toxin-antitoxin system YafQ family toxin [Puniceicoccaceae bacterium]|nr:MAG: type II toxin-antitoxin system YafQ family toxin [Puniceicoccaceae bacterium]